MTFDSHVLTLVDVASRLVNAVTPGLSGGHEVHAPRGAQRITAVAEALGGNGRRTPKVTAPQASTLARYAVRMRLVFEATEAGDLAEAAAVLNRLLESTGARPQPTFIPHTADPRTADQLAGNGDLRSAVHAHCARTRRQRNGLAGESGCATRAWPPSC